MQSWWTRKTEDVLVPITVVPEITYLLGTRIGARAELAFAQGIAAGEFPIEPLLDEDHGRIAELMGIYVDAPVGFVDASVVTMAERLDVVRLLTTDRRHFSLIRPRHTTAFQLVP